MELRHYLPHLLILTLTISTATCGLACLSNPCEHGICLDDLNSTYFCYCIDGYTGIHCQTNWNECHSSPCRHNATCTDLVAAFACSCPPGYAGALCELDLDECASGPCLNNATCSDLPNGFLCACPLGYSGRLCELDASVCNATRCANGGACVEGAGAAFSCACAPGYTGALCEAEIDECAPNPCRNGAACLDRLAAFTCLCPFGFTGRLCEDRVAICGANPCRNGALCLIEDAKPVCYCVPDYHGALCELQYDECELGPRCLNGGSCLDGVDNSSCLCPKGLTGKWCECLILDFGFDCTFIAPPVTEGATTEGATGTSTEVGTFTSRISTEIGQIWTSSTESNEVRFSTSSSSTEVSSIGSEASTTSYPLDVSLTTSDFTSTSTEFMPTNSEVSVFSTSNVFTTELSSTSEASSTNQFNPTVSTVEISTDFVLTNSTTVFTTETSEETPTSSLIGSTEVTSEFFETTIDREETTISGFDCTKSRCLNGGNCIYESSGFRCECPFDAEGETCEVLLGIKKAAFSGSSYLKHRLPDSGNTSFSFTAMTLATKDGHPKLMFSCGYQTMLLSELELQVNDGNPFKINLSFNTTQNRCFATLQINETLSMTGDQTLKTATLLKPAAKWLYLGGIPFQPPHSLIPPNFTGCINNLKIGTIKVNIFKAAEDGANVHECTAIACLANPCLNGGSCDPAPANRWRCRCQNGFQGPNCERSICETNPCHFGATCVSFTTGYLCLCPFGKHGHFCESDLKITQPFFATSIRGLSSYAAYPLPGAVNRTMAIRFRFKPTNFEQISLILFMGQSHQHDFYSDHLAVTFVKGYLMLTWNLGAGPRRIFTTRPLEGAGEFAVEIGRNGRHAWLNVTDFEIVSGRAPGALVNLDVEPILYVGGHNSRNFSILPHDLPHHTGFTGCIHSLELISGNLVISLQTGKEIEGRAVGQCGAGECTQSCQNGAVCLHHASTFMCLCQDGFYGPLCTGRSNPCDVGNHKCTNGGTCVPNLIGYSCDCPFGLVGEFCERNEEPTDVAFTGKRSFLALEVDNYEDNNLGVEFEIRTLANDGLIFFGKGPSSFVCLSIQGGFLELILGLVRFNNRITSVKSSKLVVKGVWYRVQFGAFGKSVYLGIDGNLDTGILPMENGLNFGQLVYLGGTPDLSTLPLDAATNPRFFTGCLRSFSLNKKQMPLSSKTIKFGQNVADCDGTPCGKDACLNGGTCWLDPQLKPHCLCAESNHGEFCELFKSCADQKCKNRGVCVDGSCSCALRFSGAFCETEISVSTPKFTDDSYLLIRKTSDKKREIGGVELSNLSLNFTTIQKDNLLFWSRKGNYFLGVGTEHGFLKLVSSLDSKNSALSLHQRVSDGLWHHLSVTIRPFSVKIDSVELLKGKKVQNGVMLTDGRFYVGGMPETLSIRKETLGNFQRAFAGCLASVSTNREHKITDFSRFEGRNLGKCAIRG